MSIEPFELDNIYCGDNASLMSQMPAACIDLVVTSPPYDNLRTYNGYAWDFAAVSAQLWRVIKPGGVVVWVVGDATVNGSETGTSFRQALGFMALGFNLHDTMIYRRQGRFPDATRYWQNFEYMFVFSKGQPKTINFLMQRNKYAGQKITGGKRERDGSITLHHGAMNGKTRNEEGRRGNVWEYSAGAGHMGDDELTKSHSARYPEALARDHILSWSNPGDVVLDCFVGSGTTAKMAMQNGRHYLGFDCSQEYVDLARKRVAWANPPLLVVG